MCFVCLLVFVYFFVFVVVVVVVVVLCVCVCVTGSCVSLYYHGNNLSTGMQMVVFYKCLLVKDDICIIP